MAIKLPVWLTKFRGLQITPFKLQACRYDGFGFNILSIQWQWAGNMCTQAVSNSLFYVSVFPQFEEDGDKVNELWCARIGILYFFHVILYDQESKKQPVEPITWDDEDD